MSKVAIRRQHLRDALLAAAERTIGQQGLAGLRARELAAEVGCALGAIYNVFPDLDALVLAVNARTLAAFEQFLGESDLRVENPTDPDPDVARLVRLAAAYLDFAVAYGQRWRALFEHRMSGQRDIPAWYIEAQKPLFSLVEEPLGRLRPELDSEQRRILGRSLFAAVHGIVSLGLDRKLVTLPPELLRSQVEEIVTAMGVGLRTKRTAAAWPTGKRTRARSNR